MAKLFQDKKIIMGVFQWGRERSITIHSNFIIAALSWSEPDGMTLLGLSQCLNMIICFLSSIFCIILLKERTSQTDCWGTWKVAHWTDLHFFLTQHCTLLNSNLIYLMDGVSKCDSIYVTPVFLHSNPKHSSTEYKKLENMTTCDFMKLAWNQNNLLNCQVNYENLRDLLCVGFHKLLVLANTTEGCVAVIHFVKPKCPGHSDWWSDHVNGPRAKKAMHK